MATSFYDLIRAVETAKRLPGGPCGAAAQRDVCVVTVERIITNIVDPYYSTVVTSLADVRPFFMDAPRMIAEVLAQRLTRRSARGNVGDFVSYNTVVTRLKAILYVVDHWPALNLPAEIRDVFHQAYDQMKATAMAERAPA